MWCPLNFGGLNNGSAGGQAPAVGNTANRGHVSPVDKIGSASEVLALTSPEGRNRETGLRMKKAIKLTVYPTAEASSFSGRARPFERLAKHAWRKQLETIFVTVSNVHKVIVDFSNGETETFFPKAQ